MVVTDDTDNVYHTLSKLKKSEKQAASIVKWWMLKSKRPGAKKLLNKKYLNIICYLITIIKVKANSIL